MANKGEGKSQKRLSAGKIVRIDRKKNTWLLRAKPGQHKRNESVPLGFVIRDMLGLARNLKETRKVLQTRGVKVNGIVRTSERFTVGLFDVIGIAAQKKAHRIIFDNKGRFVLREVDEKEKGVKLCRITGKKAVKCDKIQLETDDGRSIVDKKSDLSPGDSILISIPKQEIIKKIKLAKESIVYLVAGEHAGEIAKVKEIIAGTMKRPKLVSLTEKESEFLTVARNIFVVGDKKPEIELKV